MEFEVQSTLQHSRGMILWSSSTQVADGKVDVKIILAPCSFHNSLCVLNDVLDISLLKD